MVWESCTASQVFFRNIRVLMDPAQLTVEALGRGILANLSIFLKISHAVNIQLIPSQLQRRKVGVSEGTGNFQCFTHVPDKLPLQSFPKGFSCTRRYLQSKGTRSKQEEDYGTLLEE